MEVAAAEKARPPMVARTICKMTNAVDDDTLVPKMAVLHSWLNTQMFGHFYQPDLTVFGNGALFKC